jgi:hypothetical protein
MSLGQVATRVLTAMATSDLAAVRALCRHDVIVYGTDEGERWSGIEPLAAALDGMRSLGLAASWAAPPATGPGWVAGVATYTGAGLSPMPVRVTMVFDAADRLAHGHFSVEAPVA